MATRLPLDFEEVRGGMLVGRAAALAEWQWQREKRDFRRLVKNLTHYAWCRSHRELRREIANAYRRKPEVSARLAARKRRVRLAQYKDAPPVFTCRNCGAQFSHVPWRRMGGPVPHFCDNLCWQRYEHPRKRRKVWELPR